MWLTQLTMMADTAKVLCRTDGKQTCDTGLPIVGANANSLHTILSLVFAVLGAICVLLIIVGALRLIEAQGDPASITKGRNTILYALLGLVVALSAEVIVTFVLVRTT